MKTQFTISNDKVEAIAAAANVDYDTAMEWLTADWEEGEEHQDWLDTADVTEIADWLRAVTR